MNNQLAKLEKNLSVGSILVECPLNSVDDKDSLVNSFIHDTVRFGRFSHPPIIVRPRVPTNGTNPTSFGGKVTSTPPMCAPHVFDVT